VRDLPNCSFESAERGKDQDQRENEKIENQ